MLKIDFTKPNEFVFNVNVEGNLSSPITRLLFIVGSGIGIYINGVYSNGKVKFDVPALERFQKYINKARLEVIVDSSIEYPWEDDVEVTVNKDLVNADLIKVTKPIPIGDNMASSFTPEVNTVTSLSPQYKSSNIGTLADQLFDLSSIEDEDDDGDDNKDNSNNNENDEGNFHHRHRHREYNNNSNEESDEDEEEDGEGEDEESEDNGGEENDSGYDEDEDRGRVGRGYHHRRHQHWKDQNQYNELGDTDSKLSQLIGLFDYLDQDN